MLLPLNKLKKGRQAFSELKLGHTQTDEGDGDGDKGGRCEREPPIS